MCTKTDSPTETCPLKKIEEKEEVQDPTKHEIKFIIKDENENPLQGITIQVSLPPDYKNAKEGTSDINGLIHIKNIEPGTCKIESDWRNFKLDESVILK